MTCWTLTIAQTSPSQNQLDRMHWRERRRIKEVWRMLIRCAPGFLDLPKAQGPRRLTIERHSAGILDTQNLIGGAKGIIDDLVQLGVLVDDTPALLHHGAPIQVRIPRGQAGKTLLHLEEVA